MIIDGEKYACEACVRGHRVSNCQHADRPLQHINKKGRPVSQCQHCRSMRKSRSAHIKCDCGEKTHKCTHLKATLEGHKESCCCNHGGRCTCSHKKEPQLDPVPESDSDGEAPASSKPSAKTTVRRRRANTAHSDTMLTFDENGHHKPTYKHSKASQRGSPYQLGRVNSLHSAGSLSNRSMDNLHGEARCGRESPASTGTSQEQRKVKSEAASPMLSGSTFGQLNSHLPPLDLSGIEYPPYVPNSFDMFSSISDADQGLFSAGLSATSVDWSHYDLDFSSTNRTGDNFAPSSYSQAQSFGGFDFNGSEQAPTLTTTTSGEVSEVEEFMGPNVDEFDTTAAFGAANNSNNGFSIPSTRASLLGRGLDYDDLRFMKAGNKFLPTPASVSGDEPGLAAVTSAGVNNFSFVDEDPSLWLGDYAHGLPALVDSPDPNMMPFWDTQ